MKKLIGVVFLLVIVSSAWAGDRDIYIAPSSPIAIGADGWPEPARGVVIHEDGSAYQTIPGGQAADYSAPVGYVDSVGGNDNGDGYRNDQMDRDSDIYSDDDSDDYGYDDE